jgi:hypothetical protein
MVSLLVVAATPLVLGVFALSRCRREDIPVVLRAIARMIRSISQHRRGSGPRKERSVRERDG